MSMLILPPVQGLHEHPTVLVWNDGRMVYRQGSIRHEFVVTCRNTGSIGKIWKVTKYIGLFRISCEVTLGGWLTCDCDEFKRSNKCIHEYLIFLFRLRGLIKG